MTLEQLRLLHPRFIYKRYQVAHHEQTLELSFEFVLEPDIVFRPRISIPFTGTADIPALSLFVFRLGLIEAISYWKAACPGELVIEAGILPETEQGFWYDLFLHGLGEFYFRNEIDFTQADFFRIISQGSSHEAVPTALTEGHETGEPTDLVLVGGGKDSAATLGMYKQSSRTLQTMVLNPTQAALGNIEVAGLNRPIIAKRFMDPALSRLNAAGYLNGHTPFSAYLAFLGVTVAALSGFRNVIVSNERSADEGNVTYRGIEVNHQYSKSFRFEHMFREYCTNVFDDAPSYFSVLRPLNDMQIARIFASYPEFFRTFRSCNVGSKTNTWCGTCAKCAFTFLTLTPFLPYEQLVRSFGGDLLLRPDIMLHIRALVGLNPIKPFECVGTRRESQLAVYLAIDRYANDSREIPEGLVAIKSDLALSEATLIQMKDETLEIWGDTFNLPPEHLAMLRSVWQRISKRGAA